jgi:hypothetical protein
MGKSLEIAEWMFGFYFGSAIRTESSLRWAERDSYERAEDKCLVLPNGMFMNPFDIVRKSLDDNIPLQETYVNINNAIKENRADQYTVTLEEEPSDDLRQYLEYAQVLGFLSDWEFKIFIGYIENKLGIGFKKFEERPYRYLANKIVDLEGFSIDHRFYSGDIVFNAGKLLTPYGLEISREETDVDPVIDEISYTRTTTLVHNGQSYYVEYIGPDDIIRLINQLIKTEKIEFLLKDVDGDCYDFILMKTELAEKLESDGHMPFIRIN